MATREGVAQTLIVLSTAYPRFQPPKETAQVYMSLLADIPDELLKAAAVHHATNSIFFPSVAELRSAAAELRARALGIPSPEEAWINVQRAIQRFGWYGETIPAEEGGGWRVPRCLTEQERAAVEGVGGWHTLCHSDNEQADRAHFLRIYGGLVDRERQAATMLPAVENVIARLAGQMRRPMLEAK